MRLLLHDTLETRALVEPFRAGWVDPAGLEVVIDPDLTADRVGAEDVALLPTGELGRLADRVQVVPDVAVLADGAGPISLRVPVRPDEVEVTPVRLIDVGPTAELVARATLRPYFGIEVSAWLRGDDATAAEAQAVVIGGGAALAEPEGGFAEDLCRAWFIMTGQATVLHVLVAPRGMTREVLAPVLALFAAAQALDKTQRREIRRPVAERYGLTIERVTAFYERLFYVMEADDLESLAELFRRGAPGSRIAAPGPLAVMPSPLVEPVEEEDAGFVPDDEDDDLVSEDEFPDVPADDDEPGRS